MRSRVSPKLPIARAAMPMFSPSCGSTRITTGPASVMPDLVLSVPEPDISLHFLIQRLKVLNQALKDLIQYLTGARHSIACRGEFLKQYNRLSDVSESSVKTSIVPPHSGAARVHLSGTVPTTTKANPKAESTAWGYGEASMRRS